MDEHTKRSIDGLPSPVLGVKKTHELALRHVVEADLLGPRKRGDEVLPPRLAVFGRAEDAGVFVVRDPGGPVTALE